MKIEIPNATNLDLGTVDTNVSQKGGNKFWRIMKKICIVILIAIFILAISVGFLNLYVIHKVNDLIYDSDEVSNLNISGISEELVWPYVYKKVAECVKNNIEVIFDATSIRYTASNLNLKSEASIRYGKGLNYEYTDAAILRACHLLEKYADAKFKEVGVTNLYMPVLTPNKVTSRKQLNDYLE